MLFLFSFLKILVLVSFLLFLFYLLYGTVFVIKTIKKHKREEDEAIYRWPFLYIQRIVVFMFELRGIKIEKNKRNKRIEKELN